MACHILVAWASHACVATASASCLSRVTPNLVHWVRAAAELGVGLPRVNTVLLEFTRSSTSTHHCGYQGLCDSLVAPPFPRAGGMAPSTPSICSPLPKQCNQLCPTHCSAGLWPVCPPPLPELMCQRPKSSLTQPDPTRPHPAKTNTTLSYCSLGMLGSSALTQPHSCQPLHTTQPNPNPAQPSPNPTQHQPSP